MGNSSFLPYIVLVSRLRGPSSFPNMVGVLSESEGTFQGSSRSIYEVINQAFKGAEGGRKCVRGPRTGAWWL